MSAGDGSEGVKVLYVSADDGSECFKLLSVDVCGG